MEPTTVHIDTSSEQLSKHPVQFTPEDLHIHLEPIIHKMVASELSYSFQQPVDSISLKILDNPTIIKHSIDISIIHNKLLCEKYKNPLEFPDDIWAIFNNIWLYNEKTSPIYEICSKLAELFVELIDPVLQTLGYCCGRQYVYSPGVLLCYGKEQCSQILVNDNYYYYNNLEPSRLNLSNDQYRFCTQCFNSIESDAIFVGDDLTQTLVEIPKSLFLLSKNDLKEPEKMIDCIVCTRHWHQVCALHLDQIWSEGFICNTCHVTIRVLAASDKICNVKSQLKNYYPNQATDGYPYRTKAIFAFQKLEGVDVVFFGMYVQEYDEHCPAPNTRRVYISYFDTVHFFQLKIYRTDVYHEILIGYLDYVKQHGYMYAHMWACPASEDIDYIFYRHPCEQNILKLKCLQDWCKIMLDREQLQNDIKQDCLDSQIQRVIDIPYFDGDFWPIMIENNIEKLDQEDRGKQEAEDLDDPIESEHPTELSGKRKSVNTCEKKNLKKMTNQMLNCTDLLSVIFSTMEKYKETFFVIRLHDQTPSHPAVNDNKDLIECDLMETRTIFLRFFCDKNYEFSSLRRAKFSTMALLYELHASKTEKCIYSCNICRPQCEDFDLCEKCYNMELKHEHNMERLLS
ncbi:unnamed protein product [Rotaria magnacalcarata]